MTLPADLLHAISDPGGGRVVLVIGAGTSMEPPMDLPSARDCALRAHGELIADGVLADGDCADPEDLSCLADTVHDKTSGQSELVKRLRKNNFRLAEPNWGTMVAAALLCERAVLSVVTLNFDVGMTTALASIGAPADVAVINGPHETDQLRGFNLIYLHGNVYADDEEWILRTDALERDWEGEWEQLMAGRALMAPITVFAGLGTPARVLIASAERVQASIPNKAKVYQIDPVDRGVSAFADALGIPEDAYIQLRWGDFMGELASRLVRDHCEQLHVACRELIATQFRDDEDPAEIFSRLAEFDLLALGRLRARWLLKSSAYLPNRDLDLSLLADLLLAVGLVEARIGAKAFFAEDGVVEFHGDDGLLASVMVASGRGTERWSSLEAKVQAGSTRRHRRPREPRFILVGGVSGSLPEDLAPPPHLIDDGDSEDIVTAGATPEMISVDQLRASPELAEAMVA